MKQFKEYLYEMMKPEAEKLLGLSGSYNAVDLKKAYKKTALIAHPDKGGSDEAMKKVNQAYELLKTRTSDTTRTKVDWDELNKQYQKLHDIIYDELITKFKVDEFEKYFENIFNVKFTSKMIQNTNGKTTYFAGFDYEFSNNDRSKIFSINVTSESLTNIKHNSGLGSANKDISYKLYILAYGYVDGRKKKVSQSNYKSTSLHTVLRNPAEIFPKNKIDTKGKTLGKLTLKDFMLFLKKELNGITPYTNKNIILIPIKEKNHYIRVGRTVFMRTGSYEWHGIYHKISEYKYEKIHPTNFKVVRKPEEQETMNFIRDLSKKSVSDLKRIFDQNLRN